jgi:predicted transposase YbfD/YdcC
VCLDSGEKESEVPTVRKVLKEKSYYLTNEIGNYEELAQAIRQHWQVETNNHIRDVSLREDEMRSKKGFTKNSGRNQNFSNRHFTENQVPEQKSPIRRFCR